MLLMCKDIAVYNIATNTVLNSALIPGRLALEPNKENFRIWAHSRYSSTGNVVARRLQGSVFGQGNRQRVDKITRSFSLSDCYWLKEEEDPTLFAERSPYCVSFWKGAPTYEHQAIPTLYTDGYLSKWWESAEWLIKNETNPEIDRSAEETAAIEVDCCNLCKILNIPVSEIVRRDSIHVAVKNFTSVDVMLEQADTSGRLDAADFQLKDIIDVFGEPGAKMIALDAIVGNTDRHTGNFGFLRDANTGTHLGMAPLYDFDWALNPGEVDYVMITNAITALKESVWADSCVMIAEAAITAHVREEFTYRANRLLSGLATHCVE